MSICDTGSFYFTDGPCADQSASSFEKLVGRYKGPALELDATALTEFPSRYSFLGDRTLFKEVKRTQWFGSLNSTDFKLPPGHGCRQASSQEIAEGLHPLLKSELNGYIEKSQHVGILLSGGMDSRIVAGVLKEIQDERNDFAVTAFCWGQRDTRDPVYANRIAVSFNWDFKHFDITAETLRKNIEASAQEGCFYSGLHLHAMEEVADCARELKVDCMLAGSYGDSIGRAEYSGTRVERLIPISRTLRNWFGLINPDVYAVCRKNTSAELKRYHDLFGQLPDALVDELDYQLHYWRNQLGTCMGIINNKVPLKQAFTANSVVEYMWGFAPQCRTDDIYTNLLGAINQELLEIPWARTGKPYMADADVAADNLREKHHRYLTWVHQDLQEYLMDSILSGELRNSGVFNMRQVENLLKIFYKDSGLVGGRFPEIITWLGSVSVFLSKYDWEAPLVCTSSSEEKFSFSGIMELHAYAIRHRFRFRGLE